MTELTILEFKPFSIRTDFIFITCVTLCIYFTYIFIMYSKRRVTNIANKIYTLFNIQLLDIRLCFHLIAALHLIIVAIVTLSIDTMVDEDVRVKAYTTVRWKLLTCWYNLMCLAYLLLCAYSGFQQRRGFDHLYHVQKIRYMTDVVMTSVLFPVTVYGDVLFWVLMNIDPSLIGPPRIFKYLPNWCQHSLHSVSMVVVLLDLLLTPRSRPKSLVPRFLLATGFGALYTLMVFISHRNGEVLYTIFERISDFQIVMLVFISHVLYVTFFFTQWKIIDFVWRPEALNAKFK